VRPIKIEGFEKYLINEEGVVLNSETGRVLKTDLNKSGYKRVTLSANGKLLRIFVHKLVAYTYLPVYREGLVVNHKNGIKIDNHKNNLEWVTPSENRKHAFKNKLCKRPNSKLSDRKIHEICEMIRDGYTARQVQTLMEIPKHIYDDIHSRRYYKDISIDYEW
jgi:hypothetical protein